MAEQLDQYMLYRKNLGYAKNPLKPHLLSFDRYLQKQKVSWNQLQAPFFLQLRRQISTHPNIVNDILSDIRGFFQFLVRKGELDENPLKYIPRLPKRYFVPFVFSQRQTEALIKVAGKNIRQKEKYFLLDMAKYVSVVMLARCGMRINEPLRLCLCHYRKQEATVYIERTKFRKDRLIPIPRSVVAEIENYLAVRKIFYGNDQNPFLLAGRGDAPLKDQDVRSAFHRAVKDIGIDRPKQLIGNVTFGAPVPHSLRHSFAINTLNKIKARGESVKHALPVLATYMGHRKYQYTGAYLKVKDAKQLSGLIEFAKSQSVVK